MYLNLVQIAESFGVPERVVEGWIRTEGLPHTLDRERLLFDRSQVAEWAADRGLAARAGFLAPNAPAFATACRLEPLLRAGGVWRDVAPQGVPDIFDRVIAALPGATPPVRGLLTRRLRTSGGITWAPIGGGFALPHPSVRVALGHDSGTIALLCLKSPFALEEAPIDGVPVTRMLFVIAPSPRAHLDVLGRLSRALAKTSFRTLVADAAPDEQLFSSLRQADDATAAAAVSGERA